MPASVDPSGACSTLASSSTSVAGQGGKVLLGWQLAAQHLSWARDHQMVLPPQLSPGMVAWAASGNGTASPACILSIHTSTERGAFGPFVRARGIVVDGVVASPHPRWGSVYGRRLLPKSAHPHVPAIMELALLPVYWGYKLVGPSLAWRINNHPLLKDWGPPSLRSCVAPVVGNLVVWGQLLLLLVVAGAVAGALLARKRSPKAKVV